MRSAVASGRQSPLPQIAGGIGQRPRLDKQITRPGAESARTGAMQPGTGAPGPSVSRLQRPGPSVSRLLSVLASPRSEGVERLLEVGIGVAIAAQGAQRAQVFPGLLDPSGLDVQIALIVQCSQMLGIEPQCALVGRF